MTHNKKIWIEKKITQVVNEATNYGIIKIESIQRYANIILFNLEILDETFYAYKNHLFITCIGNPEDKLNIIIKKITEINGSKTR